MKTPRLYATFVLILVSIAIVEVAARQESANKQDVSSLSWMTGTWAGMSGQTEMEEQWTAAKGGSLLGVHRDLRNGRTVSFEFMRIQQAADGITYWASPGGKPATPFRAIEVSANRVIFENKEHDFPRRVIYWLASDGMLHAKIEGTINGKMESEEWVWKKQ